MLIYMPVVTMLFMVLVKKGHVEVVKYLVEQGANIHTLNDRVLFAAAWNGKWDIVKYLISQGANINADDG